MLLGSIKNNNDNSNAYDNRIHKHINILIRSILLLIGPERTF